MNDVIRISRDTFDPFALVRELMGWDPFAARSAVSDSFLPRFDVAETADAYVLRADLPGVDERDVEITVTGNRLTVAGKRDAETRSGDASHHVVERAAGSFARTFVLPDGADVEHVRAELDKGVLTVHVPKRPESQPRRIPVRGLGAGTPVQGALPADGDKARAA